MDMVDISKGTRDWMNWEHELDDIEKAGRFLNPFGRGFSASPLHASERAIRSAPSASSGVRWSPSMDTAGHSWHPPAAPSSGSGLSSLSSRLRAAEPRSGSAPGSPLRRNAPGTGRKQQPRKDLVHVAGRGTASAPPPPPLPRARPTGRANPIPESTGATPITRPGSQDIAHRGGGGGALEGRIIPPRSTGSDWAQGPSAGAGAQGSNRARNTAFAAGGAGLLGATAVGARAYAKRRAAKVAAGVAAGERASGERAALEAAERRRKLLIGGGAVGAGALGATALANR
jgi:hypothetical protein